LLLTDKNQLQTNSATLSGIGKTMEAEDVVKKFGELPSRGIVWSVLFTLSVILFGIQAIEKLVKGTVFVGTLILAGITIQNGHAQVSTWLVVFASFLFVVLILLIILLAHAAAARVAEQKRSANIMISQQKAERSFRETMQAASVIRSRQTPNASHTAKTLEEISVVYRVNKDFSATITKQFKISAADEALHFWETSIQPTSDAFPMDYLSDIKFKVLDITDPNSKVPLTYLQTENDVRSKRVCIYFLPRLLKTDPPRTIEISFTWEKYLLQLRKAGTENLYQNFKSARGTRIVTIEVWFEDGNGGNCGLEVVSSYPNLNTTLKEPGWSGFRYKAANLDPGRQEHKLSVTWTKS
jgi:hypothetical protein